MEVAQPSLSPESANSVENVGPTEVHATPPAHETPRASPLQQRNARAPAAPLRKRKWGKFVVAAILVAAAGGGVVWVKTRPVESVAVSAVIVEKGTVRDFVTSVSAGRVSAKQEATVRAEIAGRITKIHHRRGEQVLAGEPLVTYDSAELTRRMNAAYAAVAFARAQALQAQTSAATAKKTAARFTTLREVGAVTPAEADIQEGQAKALLRAADAAQAGVAQAVANLEITRLASGKAVVEAPFSATILTVTVEEGENTAPGAPLFQMADTSELHIDSEIDEADLGRIGVGMLAEVSLDAFPGAKIQGKVAEIAPSVARDPRGGRSVAIDIALAPDERLRVGMSADVDIIVDHREDAVWLPPNAVLGRGAQRTVLVIKDGLIRKQTIDVGIATWEAVEVTKGLSGGEQVVASLSKLDLADGAPVTVKGKEQ